MSLQGDTGINLTSQMDCFKYLWDIFSSSRKQPKENICKGKSHLKHFLKGYRKNFCLSNLMKVNQIS